MKVFRFKQKYAWCLLAATILFLQSYSQTPISATLCPITTPTNVEVTYTADFPDMINASYHHYDVTWTVFSGSGQITNTSNQEQVKVTWSSVPAQLKVSVKYYQYAGDDENSFPIYGIARTDESILAIGSGALFLQNQIKPSTYKESFLFNEIPNPIVESYSSVLPASCTQPQYQWYISSSVSGTFTIVPGSISSQFSFSSPLSQNVYLKRKVIMPDGYESMSNIVEYRYTNITGAPCINAAGTISTYSIHNFILNHVGSYHHYEINWAVAGGDLANNNSQEEIVATWNNFPAQLNVSITYFAYDGIDQNGMEYYSTIGTETGQIQIKGYPTTAPNVIQSSTGKKNYHYNQNPDPLTEALQSNTSTLCTVPSYRWLSSSKPIGPFNVISGATGPALSFNNPITQTTYYKREIVSPDGFSVASNTVKLELVSVNWENQNYVREHNVLIPGISDWKAVDQLPIGDKLQTTTYTDGLDRPIQKVSRETATPGNGQSTTWGDVVEIFNYDAFGRESTGYLPYSTNSVIGKLKTSPLTDQGQYYLSVYNESISYSLTVFENSPLSRVATLKPAGDKWSAGNGIRSEYDLNDGTENVRILSIGYTSGSIPISNGQYLSNLLFKTITTEYKTSADQTGKKIVEYTNKAGQLILKKVQVADNPSSGHDGWLCTYNVYDDFGLLRCQIQPEAVKWLDGNGWDFSTVNGLKILDNLCFSYEYDDRGRVVLKKNPGSAPIRMLYDKRNRLVFTQDGIQKAKSPAEWTANLYDELDRVTMRVIYRTSKSVSALQDDIDNATLVSNTPITNPVTPIKNLFLSHRDQNTNTYSADDNIELVDGFESHPSDDFSAEIKPNSLRPPIIVHITLSKNPISDQDLANPAVTTIIKYLFYDNYTFNSAKPFSSDFLNAAANVTGDPISNSQRVKGFQTGEMVRVLGTDLFLAATLFYDAKGRIIQANEENIKSGQDIATWQYQFDNRVVSFDNNHSAANSGYYNFHILTRQNYDKLGRLTGIEKKIGANNFKLIATYEYDDLGKLKRKKLDPNYTGGSTTGLETLDFSYNIHGNVTGINKDYALKTPGAYSKWGNYFGMYIGYDNKDNVFSNELLDGRMTGEIWNTQGDDAQRKFDYSYDNVGRFINAQYKQKDAVGESWGNTKTDFSVTGRNGKVEYDLNGNLQFMLTKGSIPGTSSPGIVDDLQYFYGVNAANKLVSVTDNSNTGVVNGRLGDFKDGSNGSADDYAYDENGNLTIDLNKSIKTQNGSSTTSGIKYNFLDKPEEIRIAGKGVVKIIYDADGNRLQKQFTPEGSTVIKTTTFINDFVYQDDNLEFIHFEEGRIRLIQPVGLSNQLDFLNIGGNLNMQLGKSGVWDYFLRDVKSNVRMILTEELHSGANTCTLETNRATVEEAIFGEVDASGTPTSNNVVKARFPASGIPGWSNPDIQNYVIKLGGGGGGNQPRVGPNTLLRVMSGDQISAQSMYYYVKPSGNQNNGPMESELILSLASALTGNSAINSILHDNAVSASNNVLNSNGFFTFTDPSSLPSVNDPGTPPNAFLYILFFDERFQYVPENSTRVQVPHSGEGVLSAVGVKAPKNGYAFVYVSNVSLNTTVYFDNFKVTHNHGRILEENHFYPYGLKMAGISSTKLQDPSAGIVRNKYQFQGDFAEFDEESLLNDFQLRNYDPQIARWIQQDPYNEFATPYVAMGADPVNHVDPDGGGVGGLTGFIAGAVIGGTSGALIAHNNGGKFWGTLGGGVAGAIIGGSIGYAVGESLTVDPNAFSGGSTNFFSNLRAFYKGVFNPASAGLNLNPDNTALVPYIWGERSAGAAVAEVIKAEKPSGLGNTGSFNIKPLRAKATVIGGILKVASGVATSPPPPGDFFRQFCFPQTQNIRRNFSYTSPVAGESSTVWTPNMTEAQFDFATQVIRAVNARATAAGGVLRVTNVAVTLQVKNNDANLVVNGGSEYVGPHGLTEPSRAAAPFVGMRPINNTNTGLVNFGNQATQTGQMIANRFTPGAVVTPLTPIIPGMAPTIQAQVTGILTIPITRWRCITIRISP